MDRGLRSQGTPAFGFSCYSSVSACRVQNDLLFGFWSWAHASNLKASLSQHAAISLEYREKAHQCSTNRHGLSLLPCQADGKDESPTEECRPELMDLFFMLPGASRENPNW
eukprot:6482038-Amphidinium_carterae.1